MKKISCYFLVFATALIVSNIHSLDSKTSHVIFSLFLISEATAEEVVEVDVNEYNSTATVKLVDENGNIYTTTVKLVDDNSWFGDSPDYVGSLDRAQQKLKDAHERFRETDERVRKLTNNFEKANEEVRKASETYFSALDELTSDPTKSNEKKYDQAKDASDKAKEIFRMEADKLADAEGELYQAENNIDNAKLDVRNAKMDLNAYKRAMVERGMKRDKERLDSLYKEIRSEIGRLTEEKKKCKTDECRNKVQEEIKKAIARAAKILNKKSRLKKQERDKMQSKNNEVSPEEGEEKKKQYGGIIGRLKDVLNSMQKSPNSTEGNGKKQDGNGQTDNKSPTSPQAGVANDAESEAPGNNNAKNGTAKRGEPDSTIKGASGESGMTNSNGSKGGVVIHADPSAPQ